MSDFDVGVDCLFAIFNRANRFSGVCLFCNFVRNRIYVMEIEMFEPVVLARNHKFDFGYKPSLFGN